MRWIERHRNGASIDIRGHGARTHVEAWRKYQDDLTAEPEQDEPEPQRAGAYADTSSPQPRYFESESVYGADIPIIQAGFRP